MSRRRLIYHNKLKSRTAAKEKTESWEHIKTENTWILATLTMKDTPLGPLGEETLTWHHYPL